jgi:uncharacterized protein YjiS (DUF1127 family)
MLTPPRGQSWSITKTVSRWWSNWTRKRSALAELEDYPESEIDRTAKDLGISPAEIRELVSRGPEASNLLLRRMVALDLDRNEVSRTEPRTFQDLQRVCALCESRRRCVHDLARDSADPVWQEYCPNAATLKALNALPWMSRREW